LAVLEFLILGLRFFCLGARISSIMDQDFSISQNLERIKQEIASAACSAARDSSDVTLIAVSKRQADELLSEALDAGLRVFGENRVQEAQEHWLARRAVFPDLQLHLIGPLQTNKVKDAVALFDVIHTVDRPKLARALRLEMDKQGKSIPCFIQVNTGEESQKSGVLPQDLSDFYKICREECALDVRGLMCIPPVDEPAGLHFALLRKLADGLGLAQLSMGMSDDYEKAVFLGATHVRVGSALFGARAS
jgi:pyridoxal phosphate enzyme (YggS family)